MSNTYDTIIEVELSTRESAVEIAVEIEYNWENDGIGAYEYWGNKEFDKGRNYVSVDEVKWDKAGFTDEEIEEIEIAIDKELESLSEQIEENDCSSDEPDYEPTENW